MSERLKRAKELQWAVAELLHREWDPIGVQDIPEAQDEYHAYVGPVCSRLIRHAPAREIAEYLWWVKTDQMGLPGNHPRTLAVADQLVCLQAELERNRQSKA